MEATSFGTQARSASKGFGSEYARMVANAIPKFTIDVPTVKN